MLTNKVLTDKEIWDADCTMVDFYCEGYDPIVDKNSIMDFARAIEAAVMEKLKQQEPIAHLYRDPDGKLKLNWINPPPDYVIPVYAAPVQQVGINGLTDAETDT